MISAPEASATVTASDGEQVTIFASSSIRVRADSAGSACFECGQEMPVLDVVAEGVELNF